MIVANESVARKFQYYENWVRGLPSIYRVHDVPNPERVQQFITYCMMSGHPIVGKFKNVDNAKTFKKLLDQIDAPGEEKEIIMKMAIRTMAKAIYSTDNIGHFGLASECYTHFTSPIRRYPDLQIHRLLRTYFFEGLTDQKTINYWDAHLDEIAKQSSDRERNADELERAADDMFMADYMEDHIGEEYDAIVSGIQSFGLFVQLPNRVEGLLKVENLPSDIYEYDDQLSTLMGKNSKKVYRIGSYIHVRCIGASKALSQVDFEQVNTEEKEVEKTR
jgi:ribonuclease R